jgi:hypothetical protein
MADHITWNDAVQKEGYGELHKTFLAYFVEYESWYLIKSTNARFIMKLGIYLMLFASVLYYLNGGSIKESKELLSTPVIWLMLIIAPVIILGFAIAVDWNDWQAQLKGWGKALLLLSVIPFYLPLLLLSLGQHWESLVGVLAGLGAGLTITFYLTNRLDGYTRSWSRNRTARFKVQLNHVEFQASRIDEREAHRQLLLIVNSEVEDRHKDIITDLHFFGEQVTRLVRK